MKKDINETLDGIISSVLEIRKKLHNNPEQLAVFASELAKAEDNLDSILMAID